MQTLFQDLRYSSRMLLKNPGFTLAAIITLALGIGANLTIFSFVDAFFLRPIPARKPEALVNVEGRHNGTGRTHTLLSGLRALSRSQQIVRGPGRPLFDRAAERGGRGRFARGHGAVVSANYFPMLGIQPHWGASSCRRRTLCPTVTHGGVISYAMLAKPLRRQSGRAGQRKFSSTARPVRSSVLRLRIFRGVAGSFPNEFWFRR